MKNWKPIFIPHSKVPIVLSLFAPIRISAISFGCWVWSRSELSPRLRRHETIHFQQQIELLFIFQWLLYLLFHLIGLFLYRFNGEKSYRNNPFEREAYANDGDTMYLHQRKRFSWVRYFWWRAIDRG